MHFFSRLFFRETDAGPSNVKVTRSDVSGFFMATVAITIAHFDCIEKGIELLFTDYQFYSGFIIRPYWITRQQILYY